jgi:hypothetical protein
MRIRLVTMKAMELIGEFNPLTILLLCNHLVSRSIMNSAVFGECSQEDKNRILALIEKSRAYLWCMEKFSSNVELLSTPKIEILAVTIIHDSPMDDKELMVAQFDITREGMVEVLPTNLLTFINIVLNVGAEAMKECTRDPTRLVHGLGACRTKFDQITSELAQIIGAPTRWYQNPLPISPNTSIILRLKIH